MQTGTSYIRLPTYLGDQFVLINEIVRIEALSSYSKIFLTDGKSIVIAKVLRWFENILPKELFARIHRSHLVNVHYINNYCIKTGRCIVLTGNREICVARRKAATIRKICENRFYGNA